ncbi:hypothetical protein EVAR_42387_1 [Eumeta japonica]|uniref:Uncharacterized protein n=1 Tax=Eumeta variegata TaxID=151549 RepID=A0A4C1YJI9_EUMVA|nr:hypothetical protein EVAR_42387_1 [Eumeta japonica]
MDKVWNRYDPERGSPLLSLSLLSDSFMEDFASMSYGPALSKVTAIKRRVSFRMLYFSNISMIDRATLPVVASGFMSVFRCIQKKAHENELTKRFELSDAKIKFKSELSERWSPPPMDILNPRGVTNTLSASWAEMGYGMERRLKDREWDDGGGNRQSDLSFTGR